jgi:hypothetical protein
MASRAAHWSIRKSGGSSREERVGGKPATKTCAVCHHRFPVTVMTPIQEYVNTGKSGWSLSLDLSGAKRHRAHTGRRYYRKKIVWVCNEHAKSYVREESTRRSKYRKRIATAVVIFLGFTVMGMYEEGVFSNTPPPQARLIADNVADSVSQDHDMVILHVRPEPSGARVRVINIAPVYRDGMDLEPGSYDIEVTAPGYRTYRGWHELVPGNWALDVTLEPESDR